MNTQIEAKMLIAAFAEYGKVTLNSGSGEYNIKVQNDKVVYSCSLPWNCTMLQLEKELESLRSFYRNGIV